MKKHKLLVGLMSGLCLTSTWVFAESTYVDSDGLLDAYLEDEARTVTYPSRTAAKPSKTNQDIEVQAIDVSNSETFVGDDGVEYRRIQSVDGSDVYEAVSPNTNNAANAAKTVDGVTTLPEVVISPEPEIQNVDGLEVIELESADGEYAEIEAPQSSSTTNANSHNSGLGSGSGQMYCQQNPYARECLLSDYVTRCKMDPQSIDCKSQLEKFDQFCATFPRAYKCKKAELAATCKEQPSLNQCKTFSERYCQKYPKAVFCNYN